MRDAARTHSAGMRRRNRVRRALALIASDAKLTREFAAEEYGARSGCTIVEVDGIPTRFHGDASIMADPGFAEAYNAMVRGALKLMEERGGGGQHGAS